MSADGPRTGDVLNETYQLGALIGEGAMGAVYEATHLRLKRRFAIKLLLRERAADAKMLERFQREAEVTGALGHPNIVDVVDVNRAEDGSPYLVMERIEGEDLGVRIKREGRMGIEAVVPIIAQVASALQAAHEKGVVHRDLKPQNIMLCTEGERRDVVKVLDFGISKILGDQALLTQSVAAIGTPAYMSPEQAEERAAEADARTDIFAMGVIMYQMLSGELPFVGSSVPVVLYKITNQDPPPLAERCPDLPPAVLAVVERAMRKRPEERFATARELRDALGAAAGIAVTTGEHAELLKSTAPFQRTGEPVFESTTAPFQRLGDPALSSTLSASAGEVVRARPPRRVLWLAVAGVALLVTGLGATLLIASHRNPANPPARPLVAQQTRPDIAGSPRASSPADQGATAPLDLMVAADHGRSGRKLGPRKPVVVRPAAGAGKLRVAVRDQGGDPVKARVFVDGQFVDESPLETQRLPAGVHTIKVVALGYRTQVRKVRVRPGQLESVKFEMRPEGGIQ